MRGFHQAPFPPSCSRSPPSPLPSLLLALTTKPPSLQPPSPALARAHHQARFPRSCSRSPPSPLPSLFALAPPGVALRRCRHRIRPRDHEIHRARARPAHICGRWPRTDGGAAARDGDLSDRTRWRAGQGEAGCHAVAVRGGLDRATVAHRFHGATRSVLCVCVQWRVAGREFLVHSGRGGWSLPRCERVATALSSVMCALSTTTPYFVARAVTAINDESDARWGVARLKDWLKIVGFA